jgi:hypothetical protein
MPSQTVIVVQGDLGTEVRASRFLPAGSHVLDIRGMTTTTRTRYTVQLDEVLHVDPAGAPWGYLNHSCAPNCRIDFERWCLVTTRDVAEAEPLTFNYLVTEWDMVSPFRCQCGGPGCLGRITGLKHVSAEARRRLLPSVSPYLRRRLESVASESQENGRAAMSRE